MSFDLSSYFKAWLIQIPHLQKVQALQLWGDLGVAQGALMEKEKIIEELASKSDRDRETVRHTSTLLELFVYFYHHHHSQIEAERELEKAGRRVSEYEVKISEFEEQSARFQNFIRQHVLNHAASTLNVFPSLTHNGTQNYSRGLRKAVSLGFSFCPLLFLMFVS